MTPQAAALRHAGLWRAIISRGWQSRFDRHTVTVTVTVDFPTIPGLVCPGVQALRGAPGRTPNDSCQGSGLGLGITMPVLHIHWLCAANIFKMQWSAAEGLGT